MKLLLTTLTLILITILTTPAATLLIDPQTNTLTSPTAPQFFEANPADGIFFQGTADNPFQTTLTATTPTSDRIITLPDANLNLAPDGSGSFFPARTLTGTPNLITITNGNGSGGNPTFNIGSSIARRDQSNDFSAHSQNFGTLTLGGAWPVSITGEDSLDHPRRVSFKPPSTKSMQVRIHAGGTANAAGFMLCNNLDSGNMGAAHFVLGGGSGTTLFITSEKTGTGSRPTAFSIGTSSDTLNTTINGSLTVSSGPAIFSTTTTNLTADNQTVTAAPNTSTLLLTSNSATATDRTATLANGSAPGQRLLIIWNDSDSGEILDSGNCALEGNWTPGEHDTLHLVWTGSTWAEISRSNN